MNQPCFLILFLGHGGNLEYGESFVVFLLTVR